MVDLWLTIGLCFAAAGWAIIGWSLWRFGFIARGPYPREGWVWFWVAMILFGIGSGFMVWSPNLAGWTPRY